MDKKPPDQFTPSETKHRMEAALRGARIAGHKPMADLTKKRAGVQQRKKSAAKKK